MIKFKIGDCIIPKNNGRYSNQRTWGKQIITDYGHNGYTWLTDKGFMYNDGDIEFAVEQKKIVTVYYSFLLVIRTKNLKN